MLNSASNAKGFIERELHWGLSEDPNQLPITSPSYKAFCEINEDTFATSDGRHVSIWTSKSIITTFDLKALALHYMKLINHIIAYQNQTTELFFISMRSPYKLTKHPFLFSNKVITVIHYFESSSILVTCGQGMMFTKVVIPPMFKDSTPIPEMLKFERISEIYEDTLFSNIRSPIFLDSKEVVIAYFDNLIKIHLLDGSCIQQFSNITIEPITCVNYYEDKDWLIVGDQQGTVYTIQFQSKRPFDPNAHPETGSLITSYRPETCFLLYAQVFASDFLVTISLNRRITCFSLVTEKPIQTRLFSLNPLFVHYSSSRFLIFSMKEITTFFCNIFTKHFASLSSDSVYLQRCPSLRNAARLLCHTNDSIVSLYSPKTTKLLFGIRAVHYQYDINNVVYSRDLIRDGIMIKPLYSHNPKSIFHNNHEFESYIHSFLSFDLKGENVDFNKSIREFQSTADLNLLNSDNSSDLIINTNLDSNKQSLLNLKDFLNLNFKEDYGYFMMGLNKLLMIDFHVDSKVRRKDTDDLFASTTFMKEQYLKNRKSEEMPIPKSFVSFLRIESAKYKSCLLGVCKSGRCYIFSIDNLRKSVEPTLIEEFSLGYGMVLCAVYSIVHKLVVFSCLEHTVLYDIDKHRIVQEIDRAFYRSMLVVSDRTLACGCAKGALDIRSFPSMKLQATSRKYGVYHSDHGYRRDLTKELDNYERTMLIDFSVTTIDYCSPRNALLTMSPNGEIFLWSIEAFPICHLMLDFPPTAACFLNGFGTVIISSMKTLYTIDWKTFFLDSLESEKTILDDFDLLDDKFDLDKFAETRLDHTEELEFMIKQKQTPSHKFKRVREQDWSDEPNDLMPASSSPSRTFSPFRIRRNTFQEKSKPFEDLAVDEDEFPKNHFWKQNVSAEEKPKKRKPQPYKLLKLPSSALVDIDNAFKNNEPKESEPKLFKRECKTTNNANNSVKSNKKNAKTPLNSQRTRKMTFSTPRIRISKMSKSKKSSATNSMKSFDSLTEKNDNLPKINSSRKRSKTISTKRKSLFRLNENEPNGIVTPKDIITQNNSGNNEINHNNESNQNTENNNFDKTDDTILLNQKNELTQNENPSDEIDIKVDWTDNSTSINEIQNETPLLENQIEIEINKNEADLNSVNIDETKTESNTIDLSKNETDLNNIDLNENKTESNTIDLNKNEIDLNNIELNENKEENDIVDDFNNYQKNDNTFMDLLDINANDVDIRKYKDASITAIPKEIISDDRKRYDMRVNTNIESPEPALHSKSKVVPKRKKKSQTNTNLFYPDPNMIAQASSQTDEYKSEEFDLPSESKTPSNESNSQPDATNKPMENIPKKIETKPKTKLRLMPIYRTEPIQIEIDMNKVQQEQLKPWKLLSSVSTAKHAMIREPQSDSSQRSSRRTNSKKDYKMNSDVNDTLLGIRNPLLYVQNYANESNLEEESTQKICEPYVIEDLKDPRMRFNPIGAKKL